MSNKLNTNNNDEIKVDSSYLIQPDTPISEIMDFYPHVVDFLVKEYDFYCMNCVMADWETLIEGCRSHNIVGEDFEELLQRVNELL